MKFRTLLAVGTGCALLGTAVIVPAADTSDRVVAASQSYWVEQLASGLKFPYCMTWLPNGDALITERQGGLRLFRQGKLDPNPLGGVPANFQNGLNGLKDILLDPDYSTNRTVYLLTSEGTFEDHHTAVYRARYGKGELVDVKRIFRQKENIGGFGQSSARMMFLADKTLLIAVPENHYFKPMAQRLDSHIGKTVRINRDGTVPDDNPFLNTPDALPEIWTYGHRSPNGLYQDPDTGEVWESEPGPRGGDELNVLKPGANYGWAKATWGFEYNGGLAAPLQYGAGMESPIQVWIPSVTPSGLTRYRGKTYLAWDGDFFMGELSGKALERLRIVNHRVVLQEKMLVDLEERIRDVRVGPDNHLYILTDNQNGRVLRLRPGQPRADELGQVALKLKPSELAKQSVWQEGTPEDAVKGKRAFIERCSACHGVGEAVGGGHIGPDLKGVVGRKTGGQPGFNYSPAMAQVADAWIPIALDLFLMDPPNYISGTTMTAAPVLEPEVRRQIIEFLKRESSPARQ